MCAPDDKPIIGWSATVGSKAGNSSYNIASDPAHPRCLVLTVVAVPNGEDCFSVFGQKICNCKGRGWINIDVKITY
jgi:hypothetical protein